jgi:hypothetical protein
MVIADDFAFESELEFRVFGALELYRTTPSAGLRIETHGQELCAIKKGRFLAEPAF